MKEMIGRFRAALLVTAVCACHHADSDDGEKAHTAAVVHAGIAVVTTAPMTATITAIGTVVPRPGHVASLGAPAAGRVARVWVAVGSRVGAGQPLVQLDQAIAQASQQSADASLTVAEQAYARAQRLNTEGIVPRKEVEQAAAEVAKARADAVTARHVSELSTLRAPFAGVVTRVSAVVGAPADPSQPLVEIADPTQVDIVLTVTPADAARLHVGASVRLAEGEQLASGSLGTATIADIAGAVDTTSRTIAVRLHVGATRRTLRIGESVSGEITLATLPHALVIPAAALVPEGDAFKVFVVDAKGIAHARPVRVVARADSTVAIDGVAAGDLVVTDGAYGIDDGATIVPTTTAASAGSSPAASPRTSTSGTR